MSESPKPSSQKKPKSSNDYMKYSGMAIQMGVIIFLGSYLGSYLDGRWGTDPWLTVVLALFSIFAAFYLTLKDLF